MDSAEEPVLFGGRPEGPGQHSEGRSPGDWDVVMGRLKGDEKAVEAQKRSRGGGSRSGRIGIGGGLAALQAARTWRTCSQAFDLGWVVPALQAAWGLSKSFKLVG